MPVDDLAAISLRLADLGFRKMMPNDRGIETRRFEGETHAIEVTRAVERLELAIPPKMRPTARPRRVSHDPSLVAVRAQDRVTAIAILPLRLPPIPYLRSQAGEPGL